MHTYKDYCPVFKKHIEIFLSVHLIYLNLCSQTLETVVLINFGIVRGNILLLKYLTLALLRYRTSFVQYLMERYKKLRSR